MKKEWHRQRCCVTPTGSWWHSNEPERELRAKPRQRQHLQENEPHPLCHWTEPCTTPFCIVTVLPQKMYLISFLIILHWKFSWIPLHFDTLDDINFYSPLNTSRISSILRFNTCSFWFQVYRSLCLKNLMSSGSLACSLLWLHPTRDRSSSLPEIWWKSAFVPLECIR